MPRISSPSHYGLASFRLLLTLLRQITKRDGARAHLPLSFAKLRFFKSRSKLSRRILVRSFFRSRSILTTIIVCFNGLAHNLLSSWNLSRLNASSVPRTGLRIAFSSLHLSGMNSQISSRSFFPWQEAAVVWHYMKANSSTSRIREWSSVNGEPQNVCPTTICYIYTY